jgi:prepilin-type N-terminal cleavage/methylation domain-containing protein
MIQRSRYSTPVLQCKSGNTGFSLIEVLVSITIIATFVALALQGMGVAAILSARAIQSTEAANWIQADLEELRLHSTALPQQLALCHSSQADQGYAAVLQQHLAKINPSPVKKSSTGQVFILDRTLSIDPSHAPYNVLGIKYEVTPQTGSKSILSFYTEVIPDAAFTCE